MARREELADEQWAIIPPLIPEPPRREDGRCRPWKDSLEVINGVFWVLRSVARREDMPDRFPLYRTCHRRFQQWVREGVLGSVLKALAEDLRLMRSIFLLRALRRISSSASPNRTPCGNRMAHRPVFGVRPQRIC